MNCSTCRRIISTQQFKNIDELSLEIQEHIKTCPSCQSELELKNLVKSGFQEIQELAVPANLHFSIMSRLPQEQAAENLKPQGQAGFFQLIQDFFSARRVQGLVIATILVFAMRSALVQNTKQQESLLSLEAPESAGIEIRTVEDLKEGELPSFKANDFDFYESLEIIDFPYKKQLSESTSSYTAVVSIYFESLDAFSEYQKVSEQLPEITGQGVDATRVFLASEEEADLERLLADLIGEYEQKEEQKRVRIYSKEKIESAQDLLGDQDIIWLFIVE
jgi:hypothetical protein